MLKYSQIRGICKLEGNRLGRPYHRLPDMFTSKFDILESRFGSYFLRKHRSNVNLKKIACAMDVKNKNANVLASPIGHIAFDINRPLLLTILNNFYGLEDRLTEESAKEALPPTRTEARLRNRLALELCQILFHEETLGLPLTLRADNSLVLSQWAYQITFHLGEDMHCNFTVLLDNAHTDFILNMLRKKEKTQIDEPVTSRKEKQKAIVTKIINTLPLSLSVKVAEIGMNVAELTTIKPGDILSFALPVKFPVAIGQSALFNAAIVEDSEKLYLAELMEIISEKPYE